MTLLVVLVAIAILVLVGVMSYELGRRQGREEGASPLGDFDIFVLVEFLKRMGRRRSP